MIEWISSGMCTYLISGSALLHQVLLGAELEVLVSQMLGCSAT